LKANTILFIYGVGGHKEQMKRLLRKLEKDTKNLKKIALIEKGADLNFFDKSYAIPPARDKYSHTKSLIMIPYFLIYSIFITFKIILTTNTKIIISTGPGIVFIPSLIFRILGKKVIFIETWSRFNSSSFTGKLMYKIANVFYVQNKELLSLYPNAIYSGRL
jgi:beta-1,4-N-acetylglucosaminyltransferase